MSNTGAAARQEVREFIDARLTLIRLLSESFSAAPPEGAKKTPGDTVEVSLKTQTTSGFSVGLSDLSRPESIQIELEFSVSLSLKETSVRVAEYSAKHSAIFSIVGWGGFDDWTKLHDSSFAPSFATVQHFAVKRAEETLLDAGFRGISIPVQIEFPRAGA